MRQLPKVLTLGIVVALLVIACDSNVFGPDGADHAATAPNVDARGSTLEGPYDDFEGMIFDITAMPNGSLLVPVTALDFSGNAIMEIGKRGIDDVAEIPKTGSGINGLAPLGQRNFFATSGGNDLAVDAALWRVSQGNARLVADIEAFTIGDWDRDAGFDGNDLEDAGPYPEGWKDFRCEELSAFSHGPQTNPYNITTLSGSDVLIGDAANNGVLWAKTNGELEVVAFMDPPEDPDNGGWMVLGYVDEDGNITGPEDPDAIECYVEPVPTSVAVGPDGAYYIAELTGATPHNFGGDPSPEGLARLWRMEPGTRNATCPSDECEEAMSGLNSVVDIEFGPDAKLYVVEFDIHGSMAGFGLVTPGGGTLKRCNLDAEECEVVLDEGIDNGLLLFPSAITFDKWDNLWLVENAFAPTVYQVDYQ